MFFGCSVDGISLDLELSELYFLGKILPVGVVPSYFSQNTIRELFAPTHTNTWYMDS